MAGLVLLIRGGVYLLHSPKLWAIKLTIGVFGGLIFFFMAFDYLSVKHIRKVLSKTPNKVLIFEFLDLKGYFLMAIMIAFGLIAARTALLPAQIINTFLIIMGIPLMISSLRFIKTAINKQDTYKDDIHIVRTRKRFVILLKAIIFSTILTVFIPVFIYQIVKAKAKRHCYELSNINDLPSVDAAIVLGTSQYLSGGRTNLYFSYRMQAAAELYSSGKVNYVIVSGDNSHISYNEPISMKRALIKLGVPDSVIYLDYAGFRTLDSMVRAREIFLQNRVVVVSQAFHNHRAVFIARKNNIEAFGLNARDVSHAAGFKTRIREHLARVKVMLDLYVLRTSPRFLGEPVILGEKQIH